MRHVNPKHEAPDETKRQNRPARKEPAEKSLLLSLPEPQRSARGLEDSRRAVVRHGGELCDGKAHRAEAAAPFFFFATTAATPIARADATPTHKIGEDIMLAFVVTGGAVTTGGGATGL